MVRREHGNLARDGLPDAPEAGARFPRRAQLYRLRKSKRIDGSAKVLGQNEFVAAEQHPIWRCRIEHRRGVVHVGRDDEPVVRAVYATTANWPSIFSRTVRQGSARHSANKAWAARDETGTDNGVPITPSQDLPSSALMSVFGMAFRVA